LGVVIHQASESGYQGTALGGSTRTPSCWIRVISGMYRVCRSLLTARAWLWPTVSKESVKIEIRFTRTLWTRRSESCWEALSGALPRIPPVPPQASTANHCNTARTWRSPSSLPESSGRGDGSHGCRVRQRRLRDLLRAHLCSSVMMLLVTAGKDTMYFVP
jgi:hypothetical protein